MAKHHKIIKIQKVRREWKIGLQLIENSIKMNICGFDYLSIISHLLVANRSDLYHVTGINLNLSVTGAANCVKEKRIYDNN